MWKSREGNSPPPNFWADFVANANTVFPGASLDKRTLDELHRLVVDEWRNGTQVHLIVRQLCSCDGKAVVPSEAAKQRLGRRRGIAQPPVDAVRGQVFGVEDLRDPAPLARLMAKQAMVEARLRSQYGKKSTPQRQEAIDGLLRERLEVAEALERVRGQSYWSRPAERLVKAAAPDPTPEPEAVKKPRRAPRKNVKKAEAKVTNSVPTSEPLLDPLDNDIGDELLNEIARRS